MVMKESEFKLENKGKGTKLQNSDSNEAEEWNFISIF